MMVHGIKSVSLNLACLLLILMAASGCSTANVKSSGAASPSPELKEPTAIYYEFEDILVPRDLTIVEDSTVVVSTPGYTSGIMTLRGRLEKRSLDSFFNSNMLKDNWSMVSQIKAPTSSIMIFQKASRWAVITIREKQFYTYVEVGVAPTMDKSVSGSSKNLFN